MHAQCSTPEGSLTVARVSAQPTPGLEGVYRPTPEGVAESGQTVARAERWVGLEHPSRVRPAGHADPGVPCRDALATLDDPSGVAMRG